MPEEPVTTEAASEAAIEALTQKLVKASGNAELGPLKEIVQDLYRDAVDLRAKNRELQRDLTAAKGKVKDGDVILTGDDAKSWAAIQKIGIPAAEIATKLTESTAALQKVAMYERDQVADEAAALAGYKPKALRSVVRLENLTLAIKEEADPSGAADEHGRKTKRRVPMVLVKGQNNEDDESVPLQEYVEQNLGDFREVLAGSESDRNGNRETPTLSQPRVIRQKSGENGRGSGVTDQQIEEQIATRHGGFVRA